MGYDEGRQRMVMYGGRNAAGVWQTGTWEFNGSLWEQRSTTAFIPPDPGAYMTFDRNRGRLVAIPFSTTATAFAYEWDGTNWTIIPNALPEYCTLTSVWTDARTGRASFVAYGTYSNCNSTNNTVSSLNGSSWQTVSIPNGYIRYLTAAGLDPTTNRLIVFGGAVAPNTAAPNNVMELILDLNQGPSITTQPIAQSVCSGAALNLAVTATGTSPQFQWRRNGTNISGATSATYTVLNAGAVNVGSYDCVISNSCGTVTSNSVSVTINSAPSITTQPVALPLTPGSNASFSITAQGSGLTYQWRRNGVALTSSGRVGGVTTSSLSIASVTSSDQGDYDCIVTGTCGTITSSAASLSCTPIFTQQPQGGVFQGGTTITLSTIVSTSGSTTYRWRKDGVPLFNSPLFSGTTSPALTISANDPNVSGEYTLSVTNACGTTLSAAAIVRVTCISDFNNDGNVDGDDVIVFFASWDAGLAAGDLNQDGGTDSDDVIAYFDRWDRGC